MQAADNRKLQRTFIFALKAAPSFDLLRIRQSQKGRRHGQGKMDILKNARAYAYYNLSLSITKAVASSAIIDITDSIGTRTHPPPSICFLER
jgi:hypothetical protein